MVVAFWARKIRILESIFFAKQELITRSRLRVQDFATGKNFSINHTVIIAITNLSNLIGYQLPGF